LAEDFRKTAVTHLIASVKVSSTKTLLKEERGKDDSGYTG
jgi:hypothetical protein